MNFRLLAFQHLLGTAVLAALALFLSLRYPEPAAERHFRATLALLALSGLAALPLFSQSLHGRLVFLPLAVFIAALVAFLLFAAKTITERYRALRSRRR